MKIRPTVSCLLGTLLVVSSCRKDRSPDEADTPPVIAPELKVNQLAETPSALLKSWSRSEVNWQQWDPSVLARAKDARRLIFAVIGSVRYPGTFETLDAIESRPDIVRRLNEEFVPVLADLDISRETSLVASALSAETGQPVNFPFVLLLSPNGDPVSWQPLAYQNDEMIQNFFDNSVEVISRLWDESPDYVLDDSAAKNGFRSDGMPEPDAVVEDPQERLDLYRTAIRRLTSFYEEDLSSMSGSGGLFPVGTLGCLGDATIHPQLNAELRQKALQSLNGIFSELQCSAMIDPLDGGIYSARRGPSWHFPVFVRDCTTQARAARALSLLHLEMDRPDALETALGAIRFAEAKFLTPEGLFAIATRPGDAPQEEWLWTIESVKNALTEDEFQVWKGISELDRLGNLPIEVDPDREFFRLNSLGLRRPVAEVAEETGLSPNKVRTLLESGRKKLLKVREDRFPVASVDPTPSATASFRMISAYAALYSATGSQEWRDKAIELGKACRKAFGAARFLNERPGEHPEKMSDARASAYAIACRASLDLAAVTLEDEWNLWAQDLITLMAENFISEDGRLVETRPESRVIAMTYSDRLMVFEESTAGMTRLNLSRLDALGFQTPPALHHWTVSLPKIEQFPIVHTDTLAALGHQSVRTRMAVQSGASAELIDAVASLPLERFERRMVRQPGTGVQVSAADGAGKVLTEAAEIEALAKPSSMN